MTALKAHQVDRFIASPDLQSGFILIYGTDAGLVHEHAMRLTDHFADGGETTTLDAATIDNEPDRLAIEARTPSLFGGNQVIRVRAAGNALAPAIAELLDNWPDAIVIAEAGNLTRQDKLRTLAEKSPLARTLPCYADTEKNLGEMIHQSFKQAKILVEPGVIPTLTGLLGNDREISRMEIEKLCLFARETRRLTVDDVISLSGENAALDLSQIVDSAATGHTQKLEAALIRALDAGTDPNRIMAVALSHFTALRQMKAAMATGKTAEQAMKSQRPAIHFSRQRSVEQQLRLWNDQALGRACERIYDAVGDLRKTGQMSETLARRALLAICINAAQR